LADPHQDASLESALLRHQRSAPTCEDAGLHGGERVIADKDEAGGSIPPRPTIRLLSSGNADRPLRLSRLLWISQKSTGVGSFQQPYGLLTSTFADYWAHFPDARPCGTAV